MTRKTATDIAVRAAVIACLGLCAAVGWVKLDDALGLYDLRADVNAAQSYTERALLRDEGLGGEGAQRVLEDARFWMPPNANYAVLLTARPPNNDWRNIQPFVFNHLLPRRRVALDEADWVFCFRCDRRVLDGHLEVLSVGRNVFFARILR